MFGRNEAGKSAALRAIRALLYGFEERTTDDFIHDAQRLRVGGAVRRRSGDRLQFMRRKGRKNTLLGTDGQPIEDDALVPFLAGVNPLLFSSLFGIDHAALVAGGEQILQEGGEIGSALFAAAVGSSGLRTLLTALENDANELYRPAGSKFPINRAIADFKEARRGIKETSLSAADWNSHSQSLADATRRLGEVAEEMAALRREKNIVERITRILPTVAVLKRESAKLEDMQNVRELPDDFGVRARAAATRKATAEAAISDYRARLAALKDEMAGCDPNERLIAEAVTIRSLNKELGAYQKSVADRPVIEGKRQQARNAARDILRGVRSHGTLDNIAEQRPAITAARRPIQELANRYDGLETAVRKCRQTVRDKEAEVADRKRELEGCEAEVDVLPLEQALNQARREGDLDTILRDSRKAYQKLEQQCNDELAALGFPVRTLAEVAALPVPSSETVDRYETEFTTNATQERDLAEHRARVSQEKLGIERSLEAMRLTRVIPTEANLLETRARRDHGWTLIKRAWLEHADITSEACAYDAQRPLHVAYETTVVDADQVGDRLRSEAERVATQAQHLARRAELTTQLDGISKDEEQDAAVVVRLKTRWKNCWSACQISPLSPGEMRAWLTRFTKLKDRLEPLSDAQTKAETARDRIDTNKRSLASLLAGLGVDVPAADEPLISFVDRAEALAERLETLAAARSDLRRLTGEHGKALEELERATNDLTAWREHWKVEVAVLDVKEDVRPPRVQSLLESYTELFARLDEADGYKRRVFGIDQDIEHFETKARQFIATVACEMDTSELGTAVEQLSELLRQAQAEETRRAGLEKQIRALPLDLHKAEGEQQRANDVLSALCDEGGCAKVEDLEESDRQSTALKSLRQRVSAVVEEILRGGDGSSLDALIAEADDTDADALPVRLGQISSRMGELEGESARLLETKGAEENELRRLNGESVAADKAALSQDLLASIRRHLEIYMRNRVAAIILKKEIEHYRRENQDPLLVRSGRLFSMLTCDSFVDLTSDVENDEPRLVGVRPDGKCVGVEGMSSGTRDQLYLALRFATLEKYLTKAEPMPFIVDDILINFDDERANATLGVLAELSSKTQVLLFTHHARVMEMAAGIASDHGVFVHQL